VAVDALLLPGLWDQAHRRFGCVQLGVNDNVNEGSRRRADLSVRPSMHAFTAHITISGRNEG